MQPAPLLAENYLQKDELMFYRIDDDEVDMKFVLYQETSRDGDTSTAVRPGKHVPISDG